MLFVNYMLYIYFTEACYISIVCVSCLDNCSRAAHSLAHFDVQFPNYFQLMLPHVVMHRVAPVSSENAAHADSTAICQKYAVNSYVNVF